MTDNNTLIDLSLGTIDYSGPSFLKQAAIEAIQNDYNEYSSGEGNLKLRQAIANKMSMFYDLHPNPENEIIITHGATEAAFASILGLVKPGDEVILIEPCYEIYLPIIKMAGGIPKILTLSPPSWSLTLETLSEFFNHNTRMIILNNPHNPSGHILKQQEKEAIANLCQQYDVIALSDEVYEHLVYDGLQHEPLAKHPDMYDRTITISNITKTFGMTGWKLGWTVAHSEITKKIHAVHATALGSCNSMIQQAALAALQAPKSLYEQYTQEYQDKRDTLVTALYQSELNPILPQGGIFILSDVKPLGFDTSEEFCKKLRQEAGIIIKPIHSYNPENTWVRWVFCKKEQTLRNTVARLQEFGHKLQIE